MHNILCSLASKETEVAAQDDLASLVLIFQINRTLLAPHCISEHHFTTFGHENIFAISYILGKEAQNG
jgi:hypothetical protein